MAKQEQLSPTRSNLLRLQQEVEQARAGDELLNHKREVLVHELQQMMDEAERSEREATDCFQAAYEALVEARMRMGAERLHWATLAPAATIAPTIGLRKAFRIAKVSGTPVTVLYVVDSAVLDEIARFSTQQRAEVRDELLANGRQYLAYIERLAQQAKVAVQPEIREGVPYEEIVALAGEIAADLIVMGHVGQRGPRRILIGSVTERVIEFARCPVLVAKM